VPAQLNEHAFTRVVVDFAHLPLVLVKDQWKLPEGTEALNATIAVDALS
jgi:hypothetical protein